MRILFVNSHYYMPQSFGGMSNTLHQLCQSLISRGHEAVVLSGFRFNRDRFSFLSRLEMSLRKRLSGLNASQDYSLGYPVWRSWSPESEILELSKSIRPDVIVIMGGQVVRIARRARISGVPIVIQVHDVEIEWHGGDFQEVADIPLVANSNFTADFYRKNYGARPSVIYPYMPLSSYKVSGGGRDVIFINPILRKGLRLALEIARLSPQISFSFIGNLPKKDEAGVPMIREHFLLDNVKFLPVSDDMREVYKKCRILLVPSQWEEAYGRVINEVQISGIPVIASRRGGIPEAMGCGGVLLEASDPAKVWADTLTRILSNQALYDKLGQRAIKSAKRRELDPSYILDEHESVLRNAIATFRR